jgi:Chitin binding Peritrophin-A domain
MLVKLLVLALFGCAAAQSVADPRCTIPDRVPALRLPHETDCTRHWICQGGNKHLMPACPPGLKFDTPSMSCRPAADAICGPAAETTPPPTTPPPVGTDGPTTAPPTTAPPTTAPPTTAPPTGGPSTAPPINPTVSGESFIRRKSEYSQKLIFYFSVLPPTAPTVNPENPPTEPPAEPPTEPPEEPPTEASVIEREAPRRSWLW